MRNFQPNSLLDTEQALKSNGFRRLRRLFAFTIVNRNGSQLILSTKTITFAIRFERLCSSFMLVQLAVIQSQWENLPQRNWGRWNETYPHSGVPTTLNRIVCAFLMATKLRVLRML
jgi:hypothetical protein